jgi:two-component system phosphate regulon sensor histidine kinase PhoR
MLLLVPATVLFVLSWTVRVVDENLDRQMEATARVLAAIWEASPGRLAAAVRVDLPMRVTVISRDGRVLMDTSRAPEGMENHLQRPEVRAALQGQVGHDVRVSHTLDRSLRYVAVPMRDGALRVAVPTASADVQIARLRSHLLAGIFTLVLIGLLLTEGAARYVAAPLEHLGERVRRSRLEEAVPEEGPAEVYALAHAVNEAREALRGQHRELEREHARLEAILGAIDEGVVLSDVEGRVLYLNPAAARLLSVEEAAIIGYRFADRYEGFAPSRVLERLAAGEEGAGEEALRIPEHDRTLSLRTRVLREGSGDVVLRMALLRDVSNYVRTERLRREFVANASHELRTPVAATAAALEALEMALDDPPMREEFLRRAQEEIRGLQRLAQGLLDLSTAEEQDGGGEEPAPSCTVGEVARDLVFSMQPLAALRGQRIALTAEEGLRAPIPVLDLSRVLRNLVENALKYTPEGSKVSVAVRRSEKGIAIDVVDQGAGIPPAHLQRVFERFYRLDRARSAGGAGLGLSIARHLIERRGGRLEAANEPGGGARFTVILPGS